jgi:hypothetical protein
MLLTYPDAGHGLLFQYHDFFMRQASLFLRSEKIMSGVKADADAHATFGGSGEVQSN